MATNPNPKQYQQPGSMRFFRALRDHGSAKSLVAHAHNMPRDYFVKRDDFVGTLDTAMWTATNTGTASASPVFNAQAGGAARCVAGTTNPSSSVFYGNAIFVSDDNPFMYLRFKMPAAVTTAWLEVGWTDVVTTKTTQCCTALGAQSANATAPTVSNGLTNGVVLEWNTSFTLTTPALVGVGTSIAVAGVPINKVPTTPTVYSPTAAKWVDLYIGAGVGVGYCEIYENDVFIGQFNVASGPDTATLLFPFINFGSLGTARTWDADVVELISERNTR